MIKCICVDDRNKPTTIPDHKWIKKNKEYNIISARVVLPQKQLAVQLLEINLDETCAPFTYFLGKRFAIDERDIESLMELIEETISIDKSIKEMLTDQELICWN